MNDEKPQYEYSNPKSKKISTRWYCIAHQIFITKKELQSINACHNAEFCKDCTCLYDYKLRQFVNFDANKIGG